MSVGSRLLLDTHALLWFVFDDPRMTDAAAARVEDPDVEKLLSVASIWEIAIKHQLGKLALGVGFRAFVDTHIMGVQLTPVAIDLPHLVRYSTLPLHHRDPFDRLLIAQAAVLDVPILTADRKFSAYPVSVLWG